MGNRVTLMSGREVSIDSIDAHRDVRERLERSFLATSGYGPLDPEHGFPFGPLRVPNDYEGTVVYLRSGGLASDTRAKADEQGNDLMGRGSKLLPFYSLMGVAARYGYRATGGAWVRCKYAGGLSDEQKAENAASAAAGGTPWVHDPWDGQCTAMRQYPVRDVLLGSDGEAYANNFTHEGPALGVKIEIQPDVGSGSGGPSVTPLLDGGNFTGRSKWRLYNASSYSVLSGGELKGKMLLVKRGGDRVIFRMRITGNVRDGMGDAGYFYTDSGNTTGDHIEAGDTVEIIYRAAELIPTSKPGSVDQGVGGADGIVMTGGGAPNPFGRLVNGANPRASFHMLGFENLNISGVRGVYFADCDFYHSFNIFDSSVHFRGCAVDSQVTTQIVNSQVNVTAAPLFSEVEEFASWSRPEEDVPLEPAVSVGSIFFYSASGASGGVRQVGGTVNTRRGMTVEGGWIVTGGGRFVMPAPGFADPVHLRDVIGAGTGALTVKGDSVAIIEPRNLNTSNVTNDLVLSSGAAIDLGDEDGTTVGSFFETAGWNQNFCRYAVTGGFPTGDFSAIRSSEFWE